MKITGIETFKLLGRLVQGLPDEIYLALVLTLGSVGAVAGIRGPPQLPFLGEMVGVTGFEPATPTSRT